MWFMITLAVAVALGVAARLLDRPRRYPYPRLGASARWLAFGGSMRRVY